MAFENLSPLAALWRAAGLRYLLMPQEMPMPVKPAASINDKLRERPAGRVVVLDQQASEGKSQNQAPLSSGAWQPIPPGDWPPGWQERLAQTKKGRVAWTYRELGSDLAEASANGDRRKARSSFLRRVLTDLKHPAGTHTFWPAQLAGSAGPEPDIYWSGLKVLGCRGAIIMGPDYAALLAGKAALRPWLRINHRGQFVWILPDINDFPESDYARMLGSLRKSLEPLIRKK